MTDESPLDPAARPPLAPGLTGAELLRWYYLRSELSDFARRLGVSTAGGKQELTARLAAALDGHPLPPRARTTSTGRQLAGSLTLDTVIPDGQRCSQVLRSFFTAQIGAGFTFDGHMRSFIAENAGATLSDAVAHWHATRNAAPGEIGGQFELNRFTRRWYAEHPGGSRTDLHEAWVLYRSTPTDQRDRA